MGIDALTITADRRHTVPQTEEEWRDWVSPSRTRNFVLGDPLLDWLNLYGASQGFLRDTTLPDYDPRTDFTEFIFRQGHLFEESVVRHIRTLMPVLTVAYEPEHVLDLAKAEETFRAMCVGVPIIHQGVLRDAEHRTYGAPDLLVRSDVLDKLFPGSIPADEAQFPAADLDRGPWHYRVIDIKFRTLGLLASGDLDNASSAPAYKVQLFLYNRMLGRLEGFEAPRSYLLGRGWTQQGQRGFSCMDRLAPVPQAGTLAQGRPISTAAEDALKWVRRLRTEGGGWRLFPKPTVDELFPNMSNSEDGPWHRAKPLIAERLEDLTLLWQVAEPGRGKGHAAGFRSWRAPGLTPGSVGVTGNKRPAVLQAILDLNRSNDGPPVRPSQIRAGETEWRDVPALEFYVDFETVNDLADDFSRIPVKGGQNLIFMIGCGHVEKGAWQFSSFVVDTLTEDHEARVIDDWLAHMDEVLARVDPAGEAPLVIHWSPAEATTFETAYNSAKERHPEKNWSSPRWFDFLSRVMREEPVVIRGAMAFGLKAIAKAMHQHGLIQTLWADGPTDGLGAMVGAWWCQQEAASRGLAMTNLDLIQEITRYNEVDCRVMMEAVRYLREHH